MMNTVDVTYLIFEFSETLERSDKRMGVSPADGNPVKLAGENI